MKKTKILMMALAVSAAFLMTACNDQDGVTGVRLAVSTTSSNTANVASRTAPNDLEFTSGTITIREVVFDGENESQSVSRTIEQIADINYATGEITPEVIVEVPAGNYTSVNLGIELQDDGDQASVVIEGIYTNSDDESFPIRFEFNSGEVFEAEAASVNIPEGSNITGRITFDALEWFSVLSAGQLDDATVTDGVIIISASSNSDIFDEVADGLDIATQAVFE